jgi:molecular chaperone GrpE
MSKEDIKSKNNSQQSENENDKTKITETQKETEKVDPKKKVEELEKTIAELKDSILRLLANNENERKRHVKDLEEIRKYANKRLIQRILPFLDNYKQALELSEKMKDPKISNFLLGFEMILKEF